jgi:hypothetical protein
MQGKRARGSGRSGRVQSLHGRTISIRQHRTGGSRIPGSIYLSARHGCRESDDGHPVYQECSSGTSRLAILSRTQLYTQQHSVLEFEAFSTADVDGTSTVAASLLLVFLLCKALSPRHRQVLVCSLGIVIANIGIADMRIRCCLG